MYRGVAPYRRVLGRWVSPGVDIQHHLRGENSQVFSPGWHHLCYVPEQGLQADAHGGPKPEEIETGLRRGEPVTGAPQSHPREVCIITNTVTRFSKKNK